MEMMENFFDKLAGMLWGNWLLCVLLGVGILYTIITGFVQVKYFPTIIKITIIEPLTNKSKEKGKDVDSTITSFQALCTALASCVGSGNIVGVSTALVSGGLGAIFWMWVAAFFGMATKYGEILLGMVYREKNEKGEYLGGPMYYIEKGLKLPFLGTLAALFMTIQIIGGNFIQSNTISGVMNSYFNVPTIVTAVVLMFSIFMIVSGGLKRVATCAQKMVPIMAILYVMGGLVIILINIDILPSVFKEIFTSAFTLKAGIGGVAGFTIKEAMRFGVARGLYSNEAGEGSAPVIHAAANVKHPVEQAIFGVTEVFIDTFVICTITGLLLACTGVLSSGEPASLLAINAFATIHPLFKYVASISLILFSLSTLMSQWYFGYVGLSYVFGNNIADKFKFIFPIFTIFGALSSISLVWLIQDCALGLLVIPNLIALVVLCPQVRRYTKDYFQLESENKEIRKII